MINGFTKDIIEAQQELRNLKTAHLHGLGNTLFYRYVVEVPSMASLQYTKLRINCTVVGDDLFPPYVTADFAAGEEILLNGMLYKYVTFNQSTKTASFTCVAITANPPLKLYVTSSSRLTITTEILKEFT